jgi:hypothetical protein
MLANEHLTSEKKLKHKFTWVIPCRGGGIGENNEHESPFILEK